MTHGHPQNLSTLYSGISSLNWASEDPSNATPETASTSGMVDKSSPSIEKILTTTHRPLRTPRQVQLGAAMRRAQHTGTLL